MNKPVDIKQNNPILSKNAITAPLVKYTIKNVAHIGICGNIVYSFEDGLYQQKIKVNR
jgi:hypothetical protein